MFYLNKDNYATFNSTPSLLIILNIQETASLFYCSQKRQDMIVQVLELIVSIL